MLIRSLMQRGRSGRLRLSHNMILLKFENYNKDFQPTVLTVGQCKILYR